MVVILPSLISLFINLMIFHHVRQSTKRVNAQSQTINIDDSSTIATATNSNYKTISHRDLRLLRHIVFMFCMFIGGWSPVYIYALVKPISPWSSLTLSLLILLAECSLFVDVINLFIYNHELRRRLQIRLFKCQ